MGGNERAVELSDVLLGHVTCNSVIVAVTITGLMSCDYGTVLLTGNTLQRLQTEINPRY